MNSELRKRKQNIFLEAFQKSAGNVSASCKAANINRKTYYRWRVKSPKFAQKADDAIESLYDMVESKIHKQIQEGNTVMMIFFAKTKMKSRGYIERKELEFDGVVPVTEVEIEVV